MRYQPVQISTAAGCEWARCLYRIGVWAVTAVDGQLSVTHVPTGLAARHFLGLPTARRIARDMHALSQRRCPRAVMRPDFHTWLKSRQGLKDALERCAHRDPYDAA
jgi:hypothetical protein